jgi:hypothetical protein
MQLGSMWHVSFLRVADQSHAPLEIENAASQFNFFWSVRHLSRKNVLTHGQLRTRRKTLEQIMRGKPKSRSTVTLLRLMPIGCRDKPIIFPINPNPHSVGSQHPTRIQPFSSPSCPPFAFFLPPPSFNHNRHSPLPGISPVFFPPKVIKLCQAAGPPSDRLQQQFIFAKTLLRLSFLFILDPFLVSTFLDGSADNTHQTSFPAFFYQFHDFHFPYPKPAFNSVADRQVVIRSFL